MTPEWVIACRNAGLADWFVRAMARQISPRRVFEAVRNRELSIEDGVFLVESRDKESWFARLSRWTFG